MDHITKIVQAVINLEQLHMKFTCEDDPTEYPVIETIEKTKESLWSIVEECFGFNENDFAGDGYVNFLLENLSGELTADEVIKNILNLDIVAERETVIRWELQLYKEFYQEGKLELIDFRFENLIRRVDLHEPFHKSYRKMIDDFLKGEIDEEDVVTAFEFYILKGMEEGVYIVESDGIIQ